jgi:hypothetical protein
MVRNFFLTFFLFYPLFAYNFNQKQIANLEECVKISSLFGNSPELVCSIMLNETAAGESLKHSVGDRFLKAFNRSYGIMQVRFKTCKFLIKKFGFKEFRNLPDEKILVYLMEDNKFNIAIANAYIALLRKKYKDDTKKVVIAYNSGYYNPNNVSYYKKFLKNKKLFKEFEIRYLKNKDEYNG